MDAISSTDTVLILGVGNTLLTDEGFGMRAVACLRDQYDWPANVTLQEGGTQGLMLMTAIQECSVLIVLDVVLGGQEPGTIYLLENDDLRKSRHIQSIVHISYHLRTGTGQQNLSQDNLQGIQIVRTQKHGRI